MIGQFVVIASDKAQEGNYASIRLYEEPSVHESGSPSVRETGTLDAGNIGTVLELKEVKGVAFARIFTHTSSGWCRRDLIDPV